MRWGTNGGRRIPGPGLLSIFTSAGKALACCGTQPCACLVGFLRDDWVPSERNEPGAVSRRASGLTFEYWAVS